jgi:rRNA pseudouridine-1189 N-methylase Emg1 (Nep1/Mra1 family)
MRQNLFIDALRAKLLTFDVITKIPELYNRFSGMIVTDLSPEDIAQLSCMLKEVPPESVAIYEMDSDQRIKDNKGTQFAYEGEIKTFLQKLFVR